MCWARRESRPQPAWEPCTMDMVKAYKPESNSFSNGQMLQSAYDFKKARVVVQEIAENMALELVAKRLVTDQVVFTDDNQ